MLRGLSENIDVRSALLKLGLAPETVTPKTVMDTVLLRSTSVTVKVPVVVKAALVSLKLTVSVSVFTLLITGLSSVPVILMVIVLLSVPPLPSSICTINSSFLTSPAAKYSSLLSRTE